MARFQIIKNSAAKASAATALSCILYLVNGGQGYSSLLLFFFISTVSVSAIGLLLELNRIDHEAKSQRNDLIDYLNRLEYRRSSGSSQYKAIRDAADGLESEGLKKRVVEVSRRNLMGERFPGRLLSIIGSDFGRRTEEIIRSHGFYLRSKQADIEATAQRYATMNMFLSTILPAFIVFAFIGNSILSHAEFSMMPFSFSLLVIIPSAYAVGNFVMWRRLHV
jgi:hypothetical protein